MNKPWYQSKTIWGFGVATIVALAQVFNVPYSASLVAEIVKYATGFLGFYGLRDAISPA